MGRADRKAIFASVWEECDYRFKSGEKIREYRGPHGISIFRLGRGMVLSESLKEGVPKPLVGRQIARMMSNLVGYCVECNITLNSDRTVSTAMHKKGCWVAEPLGVENFLDPDAMNHLNDPEVIAFVKKMSGGQGV